MSGGPFDRLVDACLDGLARLGLVRGGSTWWRARMRRRLDAAGAEAENVRRSVAASHRMCRDCRALVPTSERYCTECGAPMSGIPRGGAARLARMVLPSFGSASTTLLGLIGVMYIACAAVSASIFSIDVETLGRLGCSFLPYFLRGEWWRVVNPIFLHAGLLHIAFNAYTLANVGPLIEGAVGARRLAVLFVGTGIVSFLVSSFLHPRGVSVGASGALFGLIGYGVVMGYRRGASGFREIAPQLALWAGINFLFGFTMGGGMVDNAAHFGGFAAGAVAGLFVGTGPVRSPLADRLWTLAAAAAWLAPVAGFAAAFLSRVR